MEHWKQSLLLLSLLLAIAQAYPSGRVVNGTDTSIEKYPFVVSLRGPTGSHSCGASIIAPGFILTAAHCVASRTPTQISIQYANTEISAKGTNIIPVKRIFVHENYTPSMSYANDIALLQLYGNLVLNGKTIAAVQLPEQNFETEQTLTGSPGVLIGWGLNGTNGSIQKNLQEVDLKIYSNDECSERHEGETYEQYHICGGIDGGYKGQCSGDSGGPLLLNGEIQVGIVSWSVKPCTVPPYPGVYTKVAKYIHWIKNTMALAILE